MATDDSARSIRLTRWSLVDWVALSSCVLLIIASTLLLTNGSCSKPHGLSADRPVCIGGQLSIQAWLAILGLEFTIAGSTLLPRLLSIGISQSWSTAATNQGIRFDRVLNSLSSAPFMTQMRWGWKKIFVLRVLVATATLAITVLYKFSFVRVNRQDTIFTMADWIEMGNSPYIPGPFCDVATSFEGDGSVFSQNYRDLVAETNNSILYTGQRWFANTTSGPSTLFVGPGINATSVPQLLNGTVHRCVPAAYVNFTISTTQAPSVWADASAPFNDSVRLGRGSESYFSYFLAAGSLDGSLKFLPIKNGTIEADGVPKYGLNYDSIVTVTIQDCWGNFSWRNTEGYQVFTMQEPVDTFCTARDMSSFGSSYRSTTSYIYTDSIIKAYFTGRPWMTTSLDMYSWDATRGIELMLLALPMDKAPPTPPPGTIIPSSPKLKALCDAHAIQLNPGPCYYAPSQVAIVSGVLNSHGVGMTILGMVLQCLVATLCIVTLYTIFCGTLPMLSEWPAQWIRLIGDTPGEFDDAVSGTSLGKNHVRRRMKVFLTSRSGEQAFYLRFAKDRGDLLKDKKHL